MQDEAGGQMKKLKVHNPNVTCGSCRKFDGSTWCKHWNFHTTADSPPCRFYTVRARAEIRDSSELFPTDGEGGGPAGSGVD